MADVVIAITVDGLVDAAAKRWGLTDAERREVRLAMAGTSAAESAAAQGISAETVRQRRKVIYAKATVESAGKLVARVAGFTMLEVEPVQAAVEPVP